MHWISFLHSEYKYYIVVKYPDGEMKYAIRKPIEKMWILDKYINISCDFDNYETAFNYYNDCGVDLDGDSPCRVLVELPAR